MRLDGRQAWMKSDGQFLRCEYREGWKCALCKEPIGGMRLGETCRCGARLELLVSPSGGFYTPA